MTQLRSVQFSACIVALLLAWTAICPMASTVLAAGVETGTTSVSMSIDGPRLTIDLTTDGETLLARLDGLAGRGRAAVTATGPLAELLPDRLPGMILRRQAELLRHIVVQFDDRATRDTKVAKVQLETVTATATDAADELSSRITIRLSAAVPDAAGSVRWTYALASAAYPLTVRQGASVVSETIAGADSSGTVTLVNHRPPSNGRRFWAWAVPVLFAALVTLRVRERRRDLRLM